MRISDWSSDVCSSDLRGPRLCRLRSHAVRLRVVHAAGRRGRSLRAPARAACRSAGGLSARFLVAKARQRGTGAVEQHEVVALRSEEHTSELQSLMRISYAVFCLTKKKKTTQIHH